MAKTSSAPLGLEKIGDYSDPRKELVVWKLKDDEECICALAEEYRNLRTQCAANLGSVNVDGIGIFDTTRIRSCLVSRTIPNQQEGSLNIVRSDMGETLGYIVLEQEYRTQIGYKIVRDRELIQWAGRGIDVVGVENNGTLTLLLGEVKVSDQPKNPPDVVDKDENSISKKLIAHIKSHDETSKKIWDVARRSMNAPIAGLLFAAAIYWDAKAWSHLRVVCCGVLVRPMDKYTEEDFGSLKDKPELLKPARLRFLIVCINNKLEHTVLKFHKLATKGGVT